MALWPMLEARVPAELHDQRPRARSALIVVIVIPLLPDTAVPGSFQATSMHKQQARHLGMQHKTIEDYAMSPFGCTVRSRPRWR